jgi:hypothetical protein
MSKVYYYFMVIVASIGMALGALNANWDYATIYAIILAGAWISLEIKGDKDERS